MCFYVTGSEYFKTRIKTHDHNYNSDGPKTSIYGPKWLKITFKCIFNTKNVKKALCVPGSENFKTECRTPDPY